MAPSFNYREPDYEDLLDFAASELMNDVEVAGFTSSSLLESHAEENFEDRAKGTAWLDKMDKSKEGCQGCQVWLREEIERLADNDEADLYGWDRQNQYDAYEDNCIMMADERQMRML